MKKCPKCGISLVDDALFCNNCGENLSNPSVNQEKSSASEEPFTNSVLENAKKQLNNSKIGMLTVACAALALILLIIIISSIAGGGAKGAVKKYMKSVKAGDYSTTLNLTLPAKIFKNAFNEYSDGDVSLSKYVNGQEKAYAAFLKALKKEQGKLKIDYEIKKVENLDKIDDLEDYVYYDDADDFAEMMENMYEDYGFNSKKVKKVYAVQVKYEVTAGKEKIVENKTVWYVYKYSGKWYVQTSFDLDTIISECRYNDNFTDAVEAYDDAYEKFVESLMD